MLKNPKLNRKIQPEVATIRDIKIPPPSTWTLSNQIPVFEYNLGTQPVLRLTVVFKNSGRPQEHKRAVSRLALRLTREGTTSFSAAEIAEKLDFYAGSLRLDASFDRSVVVLHCLTKHLGNLLPILTELLTEPTFPEKELETIKKNAVQKLQISLTENDTLAYRRISSLMFSDAHPYGYNTEIADFDAVQSEDLVKFHRERLCADQAQIYLAGRIDDTTRQLIDQFLGKMNSKSTHFDLQMPPPQYQPSHEHVTNPNTQQTAIYLSRHLFTRKHEDYMDTMILNVILGGYFGSRLMSNIREEKGYTYGIYSSFDLMEHAGTFNISTDVGNKVLKPTLKEIYKEMNRLRTELVPVEELELVRNYMLGNMLNAIDGAFAMSSVFMGLHLENLPLSEFQQNIERIKTIDNQRIMELANKYLDPKDWWQITAGS
jgi:zinc protease